MTGFEPRLADVAGKVPQLSHNYCLSKQVSLLYRFSLYYYCDRTFKDKDPKKDTKLTIDTSVKKVERAPEFDAEDEVQEPPLESLIRTK